MCFYANLREPTSLRPSLPLSLSIFETVDPGFDTRLIEKNLAHKALPAPLDTTCSTLFHIFFLGRKILKKLADVRIGSARSAIRPCRPCGFRQFWGIPGVGSWRFMTKADCILQTYPLLLGTIRIYRANPK